MIHGKSFRTWDGINTSNKLFTIKEGLQQGTVNSPILFNIFSSKLLKMFGLNSEVDKFGKAIADDFIAYVIGTNPALLRDELNKILANLNKTYQQWNLRINPEKCESIIFRRPITGMNQRRRKIITDFQLETEHPDSKELIKIPHRKNVKYLGFHLDHLMKLNQHVDKQLEKAKKAFQANRRIFYCKNLYPKAKIICYQLLIRPIITYGSPIWWNINAAMMEKLRAFERKCLRACIGQYRTPESNFKKFVSNNKIYEQADIPRIDNFIIKLNRDYFSNLSNIDNSDLNKINNMDQIKGEKYNSSSYIFPHMFIHYDRKDLIQNHNNIPIIYHCKRTQCNKKIDYTADSFNNNRFDFTYSTSIPQRDQLDATRLNDKYWWLTEE
ncbi:GSCOCG00012947001-RA-CDS, partial [Cotesia congregata]